LVVLLILICSIDAYNQNKYTVSIKQPDPPSPPEVMTVSASPENKIVVFWQKPSDNIFNSIDIYRESPTYPDTWTLIGTADAKKDTEFVDTSANPIGQTYRYRISGVQSCGLETTACRPQRTIKLRVDRTNGKNLLLSWNPYEGREAQSYSVFRGIDLIDQVQIGTTSLNQFNDTTRSLPQGEIIYHVEANLTGLNTNSATQEIINNRSSSNFVTIKTFTGRKDTIIKRKLQIYPNPVSSKATLFFPNPLSKEYHVSIIDTNGKLVYSKMINTSLFEIERGILKEGVYLVRLSGEDLYEGKIVICYNF